MSTSSLTDKQAAVLLVLADRTGMLTTNELRDLVARAGANDDDFPELDRPLDGAAVRTVGYQLVRKGLAQEDGYLNTMRNWTITKEGRECAREFRGPSR